MFLAKKIQPIALIICLLFIAAGCSDSSTGPDEPETEFDATAILNNEANNVILQTYVNLNTEAGNLVTAVNELEANPTAATLETARQQWRSTREPWENSESFLFGPVADDGIDPALDDWPLDRTDLDNVLASSDNLKKEYIDGLQTNLKGFHTIEYLLFGESNDKTAADYTSREFEYLTAATESLKGETQRLADAWMDGVNGNSPFVGELMDAGNGSTRYATQKDGLQELIKGMEIIADEVGNGKIGDPFSQQDPNIVESQFSFNSKVDFQNNMRSIMHIYTGDYNGESGLGVSDFVIKYDSELDVRFQQEIKAAITAIGDIEGNFRDAITDNRDSVEAAQEAVLKILNTIQQDMQPLLNEI